MSIMLHRSSVFKLSLLTAALFNSSSIYADTVHQIRSGYEFHEVIDSDLVTLNPERITALNSFLKRTALPEGILGELKFHMIVNNIQSLSQWALYVRTVRSLLEDFKLSERIVLKNVTEFKNLNYARDVYLNTRRNGKVILGSWEVSFDKEGTVDEQGVQIPNIYKPDFSGGKVSLQFTKKQRDAIVESYRIMRFYLNSPQFQRLYNKEFHNLLMDDSNQTVNQSSYSRLIDIKNLDDIFLAAKNLKSWQGNDFVIYPFYDDDTATGGRFGFARHYSPWININQYSLGFLLANGNYNFSTIIHEILHTVGFSHSRNIGQTFVYGFPVLLNAYANKVKAFNESYTDIYDGANSYGEIDLLDDSYQGIVNDFMSTDKK